MKIVVFAVVLIAALALVAAAFPVFLIVFAGILFSILLRAAADAIQAHSRLSHGACLVIVVITLAAILVGNIWLFGVNFASQVDQLKISILHARDEIAEYAARYEWTRNLWAAR